MSDVLMKKCKECGKLFMPRSSRQQYCDADHYRPCPVCGKPVFAKYLSDPARRCDSCKGSKTSSSYIVNKISETVIKNTSDNVSTKEVQDMKESIKISSPNNISEEFTFDELSDHCVKAKYVGVKCAGWIPNHDYIIKAYKNRYGYVIESIEDITESELVDISLPLSSMISVNQNFKRS